MIEREGGRCPLCNEIGLTTILQFRHQVNELCVFSHHEDRGCGWQGRLSDLEHHVKSCQIGTTPDQSNPQCRIMHLNMALSLYSVVNHNYTGTVMKK